MKNLFYSVAVSAIAVFSFRALVTTNSAEVNQVSGYFIFTDCKPSADYTTITTIKSTGQQQGTNVSGNGGLCVCDLSYTQLREEIIKTADKKYKGKGNGLILNTDAATAELILIK